MVLTARSEENTDENDGQLELDLYDQSSLDETRREIG